MNKKSLHTTYYILHTTEFGFTLIELLVVMAIMGVLAGLIASNFATAQQKARDVRRKSDLAQIGRALELYMNDHSRYPGDGSGSGKIYACGGAGDGVCDWGEEFKDENSNVYMGQIPTDPRAKQGNSYFYWSNGLMYQVYAAIENQKDPVLSRDADEKVQSYSGTDCGTMGACTYGTSSSNTTPAQNGHDLVSL